MPRTMKRGDTYPPLVLVLSDENGPVDLTAANSVTVIVKTAASPAMEFVGTVTAPLVGEVTYTWAAADTDTTGDYSVEAEVDWGVDGIQTFPNAGVETLTIGDDLNPPA